jgi:DNA-binding transcriptional LysR family regulator
MGYSRRWLLLVPRTLLLLALLLGLGAQASAAPEQPPEPVYLPLVVGSAAPPIDIAATNQLIEAINAYRREHGLTAIAPSRAMMDVSASHVQDLVAHQPDAGVWSLHSWSAFGPWTPVCYVGDEFSLAGMWNKPREIARYPGDGYEIAYWNSRAATAANALAGWAASPGHNAVIVEQDGWGCDSAPWQAFGAAVSGGYAVAWFGCEPDAIATP